MFCAFANMLAVLEHRQFFYSTRISYWKKRIPGLDEAATIYVSLVK